MGRWIPVLTALVLVSAPAQARERITDGLGRPLGYSEKTERGTRYTDPMGRPLGRCREGSCTDSMNRTILRSQDNQRKIGSEPRILNGR